MILFWFLHSQPHLSLYPSHDICFVNDFDSFISAIKLETCQYKSFVLFGTRILLERSLTVLQPPVNLSKLTTNG